MNNTQHHIVFFVGIGGIGMSALARYYQACGYRVAGYDRTPSPLTRELEASGMDVVFEDSLAAFPEYIQSSAAEEVLVVYTPAIPKDSVVLNHFMNGGYRMIKRAQALGEVTAGATLLAVAGTHGKTTTSSMVSHLLHEAGVSFTAFLGGIAANFRTNYIAGDEKLVVVEADEFDRSFLWLKPTHAIVTSTDADHLDIYGDAASFASGFNDFASLVAENGTLWVNETAHLSALPNMKSYGSAGDAFAWNIAVENGAFVFDYCGNEVVYKRLVCGLPGFHNVYNAVAAISICISAGVQFEESALRLALASFRGVKRRFDVVYRGSSQVLIDDYAHHPTEIQSFVSSVRALYPSKKLTGIFQPHLFTRTRDFMDGFAEALSQLDRVILLDIYPARELPIEGVTSQVLLDKVTIADKSLVSKADLLDAISAEDEVVLTIGAGDIDRLVDPLAEKLKQLEGGEG